MESQNINRMGLLLKDDYLNNNLMEKKHNVFFVDKTGTKTEIKQYLDLMS